jgi:hypothetical protein
VKLVETLIVRDESAALDAHLSYQLNAGVDFVLAGVVGSAPEALELLDSYQREGHVRLLREPSEPATAAARTRLARLAGTELGADWVIDSGPEEFWWPRGESLKDVLAPIPPRYTVVQALRRRLFSDRDAAADFDADRMTLRRSLLASDRRSGPISAMLRSVHRADPEVVIDAAGEVAVRRFVPLRAWYPIEVFHFGGGDGEERPAQDEPDLVEDTRLRDALRTLRDHAGDDAPGRFAPPVPGLLSFRTPDVVDDAAYAVECAAVGEVDLPRLEQYISELEQRVGWLEQRFWPRVLRAGSRVVRRTGH